MSETDIVERLREAFDGADVSRKNVALRKAHDEIERVYSALKAANADTERFEREWYLRGDELEKMSADLSRMREALKPFAAFADEIDAQPAVIRTVLYDNCVRARAALSPAQKGEA